jgi:hypothetical protein
LPTTEGVDAVFGRAAGETALRTLRARRAFGTLRSEKLSHHDDLVDDAFDAN